MIYIKKILFWCCACVHTPGTFTCGVHGSRQGGLLEIDTGQDKGDIQLAILIIFQQKHMLWVIIGSGLMRHIQWVP